MASKKTKWMLRVSLIITLLAAVVLISAGISAATETNLGAKGKVNSWDGAFVRARPTKATRPLGFGRFLLKQ
jgi:hypothetical protein